MAMPFLTRDLSLLDDRFPLPLDAPFTSAMARARGIHSSELARLVQLGLLRRLIAGVYVASQVDDSLDLRVATLRLVVPPGAVVTDRTAGWLHGAPRILAPGDHQVVPRVSVFHRGRGCRLRTELLASGQRMMPDEDVMVVGGVRVTTPLRTACDLGRLLRREQALAALDSMLRLGSFDKEQLLEASSGFRGYRWVRQLRALAPLADARAESPEESILRLRWLDCPGLPTPEPQRPVAAPSWVTEGLYWVDLGVDDLKFAVEFDGEEFHGPDRAQHDAERRSWITDQEGWVLRVVRKENLHGRNQDLEKILRAGLAEARATIAQRRTFI
ncbi:hypothetical protein ACVW00_002443 [Marmoricola sp. URHA0025 HA25]